MQKAGRLTEILASYVEGAEIVDALTCLRAGQVDIPDDLLRRALDGAPDASHESPKNNQGRNAMFELSIGAMLARQNLKPRFNIGNPDVEFCFDDRRILRARPVLSARRYRMGYFPAFEEPIALPHDDNGAKGFARHSPGVS